MALSPVAVRRCFRGGILLVAGYFALWGGEYSAFDLRGLQAQRAEQEQGLVAARAELDSLRGLAKRLERDPATLERIARERWGMVGEGELLYRFVPVEPPAPADGAKAPAAP